MLRNEALAECTDEPEARRENEPESPPAPANDDAIRAHAGPRCDRADAPKTNPSPTLGTRCPRRCAPSSTGCWPPTTGRGWQRSAPPAPCGRWAWSRDDLASPEALGRALFRPAAA